MNRMNQSLVAFAISGACLLTPVASSLAAGPAIGAVPVRCLDRDDHVKYPHMHAALHSLREAKTHLKDAEEIFKGHRVEAVEHVDAAIKQVHDGLVDAGEKVESAPAQREFRRLDSDDRYPHLRKALADLYQAKEQLQSADPIFKGHRDEAIEQTNRAIAQIEDALTVH